MFIRYDRIVDDLTAFNSNVTIAVFLGTENIDVKAPIPEGPLIVKQINVRTGNKHVNRDIRPSAMCDTLTGQKARLICTARPASCMIGGTLMRDEPCARARACTNACVHAGDGACACATKYGRVDRMTDGGTPGATESGDSRDTSSHSPTHFRLELNLLSLPFSLLFFSSSSTGFLPVSSSTLVLRARRCTMRVRTHDGLACLYRPTDTFLSTIDLRCT